MEENFKQTAEQKMSKAINVLKSDFDKIRTGRAHPSILDQINVDYYGTMTPINQVATVTLLDSQTGKRMFHQTHPESCNLRLDPTQQKRKHFC